MSTTVAERTAPDLQSLASQVVASSREIIYIRPEDGLIILRPNRIHHLNETATAMLSALYNDPDGPYVDRVVAEIAARYGARPEVVRDDLLKLLLSVSAVLNDDICAAPSARLMRYGSHAHDLPVLSEIALTYRCQNRCTFCYADAPRRGSRVPEMDTAEVCTVIDRIMDEAHCPTVSFTGGEPTLRDDLPALIAHAHHKGLRVNLITNGYRCADREYVDSLASAGLDSAQLSLEGGSAAVHDAITRHPGSWERAVRGVHNLRAAGIHTHTNTTVCGGNRDHLIQLVDYVADELGSTYFSMNMVIRTGTALEHEEDDVRYSEIGAIIRAVQERASQRGVEFVWYSPTPYCLFNPVQAGLGSKSCACVDGLISVNPAGQLIPCSSFDRGIGDLLHEPFEKVWHTRTAHYWRRKEFVPPVCERCDIRQICCGACPLYWDQHGSFRELDGIAPGGSPWTGLVWKVKKTLWSGTRGVGL